MKEKQNVAVTFENDTAESDVRQTETKVSEGLGIAAVRLGANRPRGPPYCKLKLEITKPKTSVLDGCGINVFENSLITYLYESL